MKKIIWLVLLVSAFAHAQDFLMQSGTFTTCSGTFYDSGGPTGNYGSFEFEQMTLCPDSPGSYLELTFTSFDIEGGIADYMTIYDGPDTSSPAINIYGTFSPMQCSGKVTSSHPSGCLTITFNADSTNELSGWAANIGCTSVAGGITFPSGPPNAVCSGANAFCADAGALEFPNISFGDCVANAPGDVVSNSCLFTTPNPAWYYIEIAISGDLDLAIEQTTGPGGTGTGLDVDYAIWGPFSNTSVMCNDFTQGDCTADHSCTGNVVDCSYSPDPIENATIANAQVGEVYLVLITNYNGSPGFIRMTQTNSGQTGAGATDCSIVCPTMAGTKPSGCGATDGFITISGLLPQTAYTVNYQHNAVTHTLTVTSSLSGQAVINGLEPGIYTNIVTDYPDCSGPSSVTLLETLPPVLNALTGNGPVCNGTDAVFLLSGTANATVQYQINAGGIQTALLDPAGNGTVTIANATTDTTLTTLSVDVPGCSTPVVLSVTVLVNPNASITLISAPATANQTICGNVAIDPIRYSITAGIAGILFSGLPPGLIAGNFGGVLVISGSPNAPGVYHYTVETLGSGCLTAQMHGTITVVGMTTIVVTSPTANPNLCINAPMAPMTFAVSAGSTNASATGLPMGLSGTFNSGVYTISGTPLVLGNFNYTITTAGNCATASISGTITVSAAATAAIGYTGTPYCTSDTNVYAVALIGTGPYAGGLYSADAALHLDPVSGGIMPSLSAPGSYTVTYTSPLSGGCQVITSTTVAITEAPTVSIAYSPAAYCASINAWQTVTLSGTGFYNGGFFSAAPDLYLDTITGAINPALSMPGNYTVTYHTLAALGCSSASATTSVTIDAVPDAIAASNQTICSGETTNVMLTSTIAGATFNWTILPTAVLGASNGSGNSIQQVLETDVQSTVSYVITPVSPEGCTGRPVMTTVTVNPLPEPTLQDGTVCFNPVTGQGESTHTLDSGLNSAQCHFIWAYDGNVQPETGPTFTAQNPGVYTVVAIDNTTGCASFPVTATVNAIDIATSLIIEGNDVFADYQIVTVNTPVTGNFEYQLDHGHFQSSNVFGGLTFGQHTVRVRDAGGCTDITQAFSVLGYPHFFTPNGDGFNDSWNIVGLPTDAHAEIVIFDRYGKLLKQISPDGQGWNGTFNGNLLPASDYWFTVFYSDKGSRKEFKSHFSLKR